MLNAGSFREIVSGRRRGAGAALARGMLRVVETPYTWAVDWRNRGYDRDGAKAVRVPVPVISVGNLTLGGTGKTPMVKWLASFCADRGVRVAIVSRGYGAVDGQLNDEALELEQTLPSVPHVQNPDRVAGARSAIERYDAELILLDDGFQHRRLARDLDMVLLDATEPFGFGHVFPRGTLREPVAGLRRAQIVCLSRADLLDARGRAAIRQQVAGLAPDATWCEAVHRPATLRNADCEAMPLASLSGRRVAAFCGIGNPAAFRQTLAEQSANVVFWREFPDHFAYTPAEVADLASAVGASRAELIVTTRKDLVKLPQVMLGEKPLWALEIELDLRSDEAEVVASVQRVIDATRPVTS